MFVIGARRNTRRPTFHSLPNHLISSRHIGKIVPRRPEGNVGLTIRALRSTGWGCFSRSGHRRGRSLANSSAKRSAPDRRDRVARGGKISIARSPTVGASMRRSGQPDRLHQSLMCAEQLRASRARAGSVPRPACHRHRGGGHARLHTFTTSRCTCRSSRCRGVMGRGRARGATLVPIHEVNFPRSRRGALVTVAPAAHATFDILLRLEVAELFPFFPFLVLWLFFLFCHGFVHLSTSHPGGESRLPVGRRINLRRILRLPEAER
jgi:hypothetical protein